MFLQACFGPQGFAWFLGGVLVPGPGGVSAPGGIPACTEADTPPGETATAADGTHPTGMYSCHKFKSNLRDLQNLI